jgi:hypothetical protein
VLDFILRPIIGVELPKKVFTSRARWTSLIVKWNASTSMFYLLKHLLLFILVIFKLMCNNLIFNEIMALSALGLAHSVYVSNTPPWWWDYGFECFICVFACILTSSRITRSRCWKMDPTFLRWFCHICCQVVAGWPSHMAKRLGGAASTDSGFSSSCGCVETKARAKPPQTLVDSALGLAHSVYVSNTPPWWWWFWHLVNFTL